MNYTIDETFVGIEILKSMGVSRIRVERWIGRNYNYILAFLHLPEQSLSMLGGRLCHGANETNFGPRGIGRISSKVLDRCLESCPD